MPKVRQVAAGVDSTVATSGGPVSFTDGSASSTSAKLGKRQQSLAELDASVAVVGDSATLVAGIKAVLKTSGFNLIPTPDRAPTVLVLAHQTSRWQDFVVAEPTVTILGSGVDWPFWPQAPAQSRCCVIDVNMIDTLLVPALRAAHLGAVIVPRRLLPLGTSALSKEEIEWMQELRRGSRAIDLAFALGMSERTFYRRLDLIYKKLGVAGRREALAALDEHSSL